MQATDEIDIDDSLRELSALDGNEPDNLKSKTPTKNKELFSPKTKEEINGLSKIEALEYQIELKKFETKKLKTELKQAQRQGDTESRKKETRELIIWGRLIKSQVKNHPDRKLTYMELAGWMEQYLTNDRDRALLGFPLLDADNSEDNNAN